VPDLAWRILAFGVIGATMLVTAARTAAIARRPIHLRWELAPVPRRDRKASYGGSYFEEYEWWMKPRRHSRVAALVYTAKEMLLMRSIWKHNRGLWPLTLTFHYGLYLIAGLSLWLAAYSILAAVGLAPLPGQLLRGSFSALALLGYVLGSVGAIGLLLKRALDPHLRPFNSASRYINLLFLTFVFLSGGYAWFRSWDFVAELSRFARSLIILNAETTISSPLSLHLVVSFLFLLYLPLTDMIHFIAKYFTYHAVRWDDRPQNDGMQGELGSLLSQPVTWSASHIGSGGQKTWAEIIALESGDETTA
jgi:nitrate reductase gamma subunit